MKKPFTSHYKYKQLSHFTFTRVFLAPGGGNQYLKANFLHGGLFGSIDDWVKFPRISPGAKRPKNAFFKMAA